MWRLLVVGLVFAVRDEDYVEDVYYRLPSPPPSIPYYCQYLRPVTNRTTWFRRGQSPYEVSATWHGQDVLGIHVHCDTTSFAAGGYLQVAYQVRLHDTRPIGWFLADDFAVTTSCPPGRQNLMYYFNFHSVRSHGVLWNPPKWFKNHTAKVFFMVMNIHHRYWRGNVTVSDRYAPTVYAEYEESATTADLVTLRLFDT